MPEIASSFDSKEYFNKLYDANLSANKSTSSNVQDPLTEQTRLDRESDRELKKKYAVMFLIFISLQTFLLFIILFMIGCGWMTFDEWTLKLFIAATITETYGIVRLIVKHLFPTRT